MKKSRIIFTILFLFVFILLGACVRINPYNHHSLVFFMGKFEREVKKEGPFLVPPLLWSVQQEYLGDQMYDLPPSDVITADKKSMTADSYAVWHITDALDFYQNVKNTATAENRLNVSIYNSMKNVISSSTQNDAISDTMLGMRIRNNLKMGDNKYGLEVSNIEMKHLDLPKDNKEGVFQRMKSERQVIEAQYLAEGEKSYKTKTATVDSKVRQIESNAQVQAAKIEAEAEAEYFRILAEAYSSSPERTEFYNYLLQLQALEDSFQSGTLILNQDSPFYGVLNSALDVPEIAAKVEK